MWRWLFRTMSRFWFCVFGLECIDNCFPLTRIDSYGNATSTALCPYQQSQKTQPQPSASSAHISDTRTALKHQEPEEQLRTARAFVAISSMLTAILSNPIEISSAAVLGRTTPHQKLCGKTKDTHYYLLRTKFSALHRLNNFFIDECHQTFFACTYAFYPSGVLKWSSLCSLLLTEGAGSSKKGQASSSSAAADQQLQQCCCGGDGESSICSGSLFTNRQLYLLSAVIKAFSAGSLLLVSFFPTFQSFIVEPPYDDEKEGSGMC